MTSLQFSFILNLLKSYGCVFVIGGTHGVRLLTKLSMCMSPQFGRVWCIWTKQSEGFDASGHQMLCECWLCASCCLWRWGDRLSTPQAPRLSLPQRCRHRRRRDCTSGPPPHIVGLHFDNASSCTTMCFGSSPSRKLLEWTSCASTRQTRSHRSSCFSRQSFRM